MPKKLILILAAAASLLAAGRASAQISVPPALNYQGVLTPIGGTLTPGFYTLAFRLYTAPVGGSAVWARSFTNIYVGSNCVVNCTLNDAGAELLPSGASILVAAMTNTPPVYLGLTVVQTPAGAVASPVEIVPRWPFLSVPYSLTAALADNAHALNTSTPVTNFLALGTSYWPPGNYALGYANPGGTGSALPMANNINVTNNGLLFSSGLTCMSNLQVTQLVTTNITYTPKTNLFTGPVRLLQPGYMVGEFIMQGLYTNIWYSFGPSAFPRPGLISLSEVGESDATIQYYFQIYLTTGQLWANNMGCNMQLLPLGFLMDPLAVNVCVPAVRFMPIPQDGQISLMQPLLSPYSSNTIVTMGISLLPFGVP